ncbi:MAG: sugar phosphate isomerase/epimerase [Bacteroidales bacterium]|nr:sugar phosphate isomerase/epimerase [Bacteroidales bacterium]
MSIVLSVSSFHKQFVTKKIDLAKFFIISNKLGFRSVEICDRSIEKTDRIYLESIRNLLKKNSLSLCALDIRNDFTYGEKEKLLQQINHVKKWIEIASFFQTPIVRIWGGQASTTDTALQRVCDAISSLIPHAQKHHIKLALENHGGICANFENVLKIIHRISSETLGICCDFQYFSEEDLYIGIERFAPHIIHVHAKSFSFDDHGEETRISYRTIGEILHKHEYSGNYSIEFEGKGNAREGIINTNRLIENYFLNTPLRKTEAMAFLPRMRKLNIELNKCNNQYLKVIKTKNIWTDARKHILEFAENLASKPEVEGVVVLGGLADTTFRRHIDDCSDLDIAVFINVPEALGYSNSKEFVRDKQEFLPEWLPEFQFYIPVNKMMMEVNCHQLIYQIEISPDLQWDESKIEAYKFTGEVLFDRHGLIKDLIFNKTAFIAEKSNRKLIILAGQLPWYSWINPEKQLKRGYPEACHYLLNKALDLILEMVYNINDREKPHHKWLIQTSETLNWLPQNFLEIINEAIIIRNYTKKEIFRRIKIVKALGQAVINYGIDNNMIPKDSFKFTSLYLDHERQLLPITYADHLVNKIMEDNVMSEEEEQAFRGLINFSLLANGDLKAVNIRKNAGYFGVNNKILKTFIR